MLMPQAMTAVVLVLGLAGAGLGCGQRLVGRLPADAGADEGIARVDARDSGTDLAADVGGGTDLAPDLAPDTNGPDAPPPIPELPQVCTSERWCWTHPLPTGDRFVSAFGIGDDDLRLLGASGAILRFSGGVWSTVTPAPTIASSMWASAADDVWVAGPNSAYHWDGGSWMQRVIPTNPSQRATRAIWGCAPNNLWVVGDVAMNWDGSQFVWYQMPIEASTRTVWGSGCNDVWAGALIPFTGTGRIMRFDGSSWRDIASQPAEQIAGTGPDDVWSLAQGQLHHWTGPGTGALVDSHTLNLFSVGSAAVGTMSENRVVSVRARSGVTSLPAPAPEGADALWGRSANDIWGFGARGAVTHWNGNAWTAELPGWALTRDDIVEVTGSGPTDLWAATSGGTLLHGDGSTWQTTALTAQQVNGRIYDVWARAADDVWVLGGDALIHRWNGTVWETQDPPPRGTTTPEMRAVSGTSRDDVWILRGANSILHWDGTSWISRQPYIDKPERIWAAGPDNLWVVGVDGVSHWDGTYWQTPRFPAGIGPSCTAVGGSGPTDVWVLTADNVLKASDDQTELVSVFIGNPAWRAASLTPVATGGVWVLFQDGIVGSRLYRFPGTDSFGAVLSPAGLNDVWLAPDGALWAAGTGGALVRRAPAP
jgi:hypothetical protein